MKKTIVIALAICGLMGTAVAQQTPNTATSAGSNNQLSNERTDPTAAKPYQPAKPGPDTRAAPTSSSSGVGASSGGRPENTK